jgi:hypothetical protein
VKDDKTYYDVIAVRIVVVPNILGKGPLFMTPVRLPMRATFVLLFRWAIAPSF